LSLQLSELLRKSLFCNLCQDKDRSEPVNPDTQVGGDNQERKSKQLAKQEKSIEDKKQAIHLRLLPASNTKHTHNPTRQEAFSTKQQSIRRAGAANLTPILIVCTLM
jgi:hypothetical protein